MDWCGDSWATPLMAGSPSKPRRAAVPFRYKAVAILLTLAVLSLIAPARRLIAYERAALANRQLGDTTAGETSPGTAYGFVTGRARRLQQNVPVVEGEGEETVPDDADDELCSSAIADLPAEQRCLHVEARAASSPVELCLLLFVCSEETAFLRAAPHRGNI